MLFRGADRTNAGLIQGVDLQRIIAQGDGDGIGQHILLLPGETDRLEARVFVETGQAVLKPGLFGQANDVIDATTGTGTWQDLSVEYIPTPITNTFVIYGLGGPATFKIDDVGIRPLPEPDFFVAAAIGE